MITHGGSQTESAVIVKHRHSFSADRLDILNLWDYIRHGDAEHQAWLLQALVDFFDNKPAP